MNKMGVVLGVAAVSVLAGCLDPNYRSQKETGKTIFNTSRNVAQPRPAEVAPVDRPVVKPVMPAVTEKDTTAAIEITVDNEPVDVKPVHGQTPTVVVPPPPVEPETTTYIVQPGDTLSKISKKTNIKIDAIKRANPQLKGDIVRLGQKLTLPGKIDVGVQTVPEGAFARPPQPKPYTPYTGTTQDYVIKGGDTLGAIAIKNGVSTRQLKELNGMTTDVIRVGQKIKVPAKGAATVAAVAPANPADAKKVDVKPPVVKPNGNKEDKKPVVENKTEEVAPPVADPVVVEPPAEKYIDYTVQEGDDLVGISINFDLTTSEIRALNNLGDDAQVTPGMVLKLPAGNVQ